MTLNKVWNRCNGFRLGFCAGLMIIVCLWILGRQVYSKAKLSPVDGRIFIKCFGRVFTDERGCEFVPLENTKVSLWDKNRTKEVPVEYTNRHGEFYIDDEYLFGYWIMITDEPKSGGHSSYSRRHKESIIGCTHTEMYLHFSKEGYEDLFLDLGDFREGFLIDCATSIELILHAEKSDSQLQSVTKIRFSDEEVRLPWVSSSGWAIFGDE